MEVPVYLFTGFMDSGKTHLIKDTLMNSEIAADEKCLVIMCEDGEEEYEPAECKRNHVIIEEITKEEDFTRENLTRIYQKYLADAVFIEYNGTWKMSTFTDMELPQDWELVQVLSTVDSTTFESYLGNMRTMVMDQLCISDVVIFNRCNENTPKASFRRQVKAQNRKAQIVYELENGEIDENEDAELPYDINQDFLEISDADYGIFYLDVMDHTKLYHGKTIKYRALVYRPDNYKKGQMVPGRFAMTCCVEDIQFLGFITKYDRADTIPHKGWIDITAKLSYEFCKDYKGKGPVLYPIEVTPAEKPEDELVYFT